MPQPRGSGILANKGHTTAKAHTSYLGCGLRTHVPGLNLWQELGIRLKSIRNIEKITKTMKMISSAKFAKSSKKIGPARAFGTGAQAIDAVSQNLKIFF